jgi:hypothetical protein
VPYRQNQNTPRSYLMEEIPPIAPQLSRNAGRRIIGQIINKI